MEFRDWLKFIFESSSIDTCRVITCALWAIWTCRNKFIHEGVVQTGAQIASFVKNFLQELDGFERSIPVERLCVANWVASTGRRLKINFDAAYDKQRKESCSGLVVRNGKAEIICSKSVMNVNIPSAFAAEGTACVQALQLGVSFGLREVEIEGDSRSVIRKLQDEKEDRFEIAGFIHESKNLSLIFQSCIFLFTNREANKRLQLNLSEN
ncbi:hypothetical protein J1N35_013526 [Gossypium stocksii]|uniref:RNase H type-1 domain-containing protein n=1 Tax=Gossypium stocksii TaxID=47602 RepID=A0A9D4A7Z6_9ROSI|nr:hypothetical protein J1N35_013526 [Gossypium stocksii]